jgi:2-polyprenyl-6-methoxyphenol hydroxylase-like FAD-dependent oxidoreductase
MAGMLPVGTRPGDPVPRLSFFWSLPVAELDRAGRDEAAWRASVQGVWPEALDRLADTAVPAGLAQARYRDAMHATWHRGCTVLLGDAAHAMSPQLGQGVNMALLDAQAIADALHEHAVIEHALPHYARTRASHIAVYQWLSRWLTPLFQSNHAMLGTLRDRAFGPFGQMPLARREMLKILTGTKRGWFR